MGSDRAARVRLAIKNPDTSTASIDRREVLRELREMILSGQASRPISIGQLHAFQRFHLRPINLLVWKGPSGPYGRDT